RSYCDFPRPRESSAITRWADMGSAASARASVSKSAAVRASPGRQTTGKAAAPRRGRHSCTCTRSPSWAGVKGEVGTSVISGPVVIHSYVIPGRRRSWIEFIRGRLGEPVLRDAHFVRSSAWGPRPEERAQRASRRAGSPGALGRRNDDCCYWALILGAI